MEFSKKVCLVFKLCICSKMIRVDASKKLKICTSCLLKTIEWRRTLLNEYQPQKKATRARFFFFNVLRFEKLDWEKTFGLNLSRMELMLLQQWVRSDMTSWHHSLLLCTHRNPTKGVVHYHLKSSCIKKTVIWVGNHF